MRRRCQQLLQFLARTGEALVWLRARHADNTLPLLRLPEKRDDIATILRERDKVRPGAVPEIGYHLVAHVGEPAWDLPKGVMHGSPDKIARAQRRQMSDAAVIAVRVRILHVPRRLAADPLAVHAGHDYLLNNLGFTLDREPGNSVAAGLRSSVATAAIVGVMFSRMPVNI